LGVVIRYCVWGVLRESIEKGWLIDRGRNLGSIGGEGMFKAELLDD
jgi:hypothetical protein